MSPTEIIKRPFFSPLIILIVVLIWHDHYSSIDVLKSVPDEKGVYHGILADNPQIKDKKTKLKVSLGLDVKVLITILSDQLEFGKGDTIEFKGKIKKPTSYRNPGGFNYVQYLKRQEIGATVFIENPDDIRLISRAELSHWGGAVLDLKRKTKRLLAGEASPEVRGVLYALLWGDRALIDSHTDEIFRNQGLSHLLVISGLHFVSLALVFFWLVVGIFKFFPKLLLYFPVRKIAAVGTLIFLTAFYFFCEPAPSVTRAYIAVTCFFVAMILNRSSDLLNILFLAAFLILLINPDDLFNLSFQFSFTAVLSLIIIFPLLKRKRIEEFFKEKKPRILFIILGRGIDIFLANLAIFIGLGPLIVYYFHEAQWMGLVMNLWAVPLTSLLVVPLGLAALVLNILIPPLAPVLFSINLTIIQGILLLLEWAYIHLPSPALVFPPRGWELIVYYLLILAVVLRFSPRIKKGLIFAAVFILVVDLAFVVYRMKWSDDFKITHIDVGNGDSILVELPDAKRVLIDGGGSPYFDLGENVLIPFLLHKRIPSLDAICITHPDTDHYLGLSTLVEKYSFKELWWNGIPHDSQSYQELFDQARRKNARVVALARGEKIPVGDEAVFEVFSPEEGGGGQTAPTGHNNNQSLVLKLKTKNYSALFTGDIEWQREAELVSTFGEKLDSDYLKVPHHGSVNSSSDEFLKMVAPRVATVGSRQMSHYKHPHPKTVKRYERLGIPLHRTDLQGAVLVGFEEAGIVAETYVNQ